MHQALHQTFSAATAVLVGASIDRRNRLADSWRHICMEIEDHILFIRQHSKTVAERDDMLMPGVRVHRPERVAYCERMLAERLPRYRDALRRVCEAEAEMDRIGMAYAKSSYAWDVELEARRDRRAA